MLTIREYVAMSMCLMVCDSVCYYEEQCTTPQRAYEIQHGIQSVRICIKNCLDAPKCKSATYSDAKRICHLQVPSEYPSCSDGVMMPFRRFVKTEENCVATEGVQYVRTNLSREHGVDPCFPDSSLLHFDLVQLDGSGGTACPIRPLDGSQGPVLVLRGVDGSGPYRTFGTHSDTRIVNNTASNCFLVAKPTARFLISAACVEESPDDQCLCKPISQLQTHPGGTYPALFVTTGACPGKTLYVTPWGYPEKSFVGSQARLFCVAGEWMAGEMASGNFWIVTKAVCD